MNFDNKGFQDFRRDFEFAMKALGEKHNVSIGMGNISYNEAQFVSKMTVIKKGGVIEGTSHAQINFEQNAELFGLTKGDWNKIVKLSDGTPAKLVGVEPRSHKYPFIVETASGKKYKMSASQVRKTIER